MNSRVLVGRTASCASGQNDRIADGRGSSQWLAALRDFAPSYDRLGQQHAFPISGLLLSPNQQTFSLITNPSGAITGFMQRGIAVLQQVHGVSDLTDVSSASVGLLHAL